MQREKAQQKAKSKKISEKDAKSKSEEANPHAFKNTHVVTPDLIMQQKEKLLAETVAIKEAEREESDYTQSFMDIQLNVDKQKDEEQKKKEFVNMYNRID